jgi:hypothetical protein
LRPNCWRKQKIWRVVAAHNRELADQSEAIDSPEPNLSLDLPLLVWVCYIASIDHELCTVRPSRTFQTEADRGRRDRAARKQVAIND